MATNKKGKTSKSAKSGKASKKVEVYVKKERPKKKELLIEITKEISAEITKESGIIDTFRGKRIKKICKRYGKDYILLDNTEEITSI